MSFASAALAARQRVARDARMTGGRRSDQGGVWAEVDRKRAEVGASFSATGAMGDAYRDRSREEQVLNISRKEQKEGPKILEPGKISPRPRPEVITGTTTKVATGCGNLYVTINIDEKNRPFELFTQMGKAGGCAASQLEAIGRLVSLAFRSGIEVKSIIEQLRNIRCPSPSWEKGQRIFSCADAIARVVERRLVNNQAAVVVAETPQLAMKHSSGDESVSVDIGMHGDIVGVCPDCGGALRHEEGCIKCQVCGFSKC